MGRWDGRLRGLVLGLLVLLGPARGDGEPLTQPTSRVLLQCAGARDPGGLRSRLHAARAGEATFRVLHFGDSHVAADLFPDGVRRRLQQQYGDGGPGFVGLGRPPGRYAHRQLRFRRGGTWQEEWIRDHRWRDDGIYGLDGVLVTSRSPGAWLSLQDVTPSPTPLRRLELWTWPTPEGGGLELRLDGVVHRPPSPAVTTTSWRREVVPVEPGVRTLQLRQRGPGPVRLLGVTAERGPGVVWDALGVNGARAISLLHRDPRLLAELIRARAPALLVLGYGTNEGADQDEPLEVYREALHQVLLLLRWAAGDEPDCLLLGPTDWPLRRAGQPPAPNPRLRLITEVQGELAARHGCLFWDTQAAMGGPGSILRWAVSSPALARPDLLHLTPAGYDLLASLLTEALTAALEQGDCSGATL